MSAFYFRIDFVARLVVRILMLEGGRSGSWKELFWGYNSVSDGRMAYRGVW